MPRDNEMKFTAKSKNLLAAIARLSSIPGEKLSLSSGCVTIIADEFDGLELIRSNGDSRIAIKCVADVSEAGKHMISYDTLSAMLARASGEDCGISSDTKFVTVKSAKTTVKIPAVPNEAWPQPPPIFTTGAQIKMLISEARALLGLLSSATSPDSPDLTCINFISKDGRSIAYATDRRKFFSFDLPKCSNFARNEDAETASDPGASIPLDCASAMMKILAKQEDGTATISFSHIAVRLACDGCDAVFPLKNKYPINPFGLLDKISSDDHRAEIVVSSSGLLEAARCAAPMSGEYSKLWIESSAGGIKLSASGKDGVSIEDEIAATTTGEFNFCANAKYMTEFARCSILPEMVIKYNDTAHFLTCKQGQQFMAISLLQEQPAK